MTIPRGFTRCDECAVENGGNGKGWAKGFPPIGRPCPSCSGSGLVPTEKLREDVSASLWESWWDYKREPWRLALSKRSAEELDLYREQADAVLRKVAEHLGDRE